MIFEMMRFGLTGVLNTIVGLGVMYVAWRFAGFPVVVANACGYLVGLCVSFTINRAWTFKSRRDVRKSGPAFVAVVAVAYLANLACLLLLRRAGVSVEWSNVLSTIPYTAISYFGSRWFVFPAARTGSASMQGQDDTRLRGHP